MILNQKIYHVGLIAILITFLANLRMALSFTTIPRRTFCGHPCLADPKISNVPTFLCMSKKDPPNAEDDKSSGLQENNNEEQSTLSLLRRALLASSGIAALQLLVSNTYAPAGFKRIPTQFIAALGDPNSSSGTEAKEWGLWTVDPGPRGVWLRDYKKVLDEQSTNGIAPAGWKFDANDWWLEEHGLIMEAPDFPLEPGRYLVTGGRMVTTGLTVDTNGGWKLDDGKLYDVTHLPCRSARYNPIRAEEGGGGSPLTAKTSDFPVAPGAEMPKVQGCVKQDYAVLFVIGVEDV